MLALEPLPFPPANLKRGGGQCLDCGRAARQSASEPDGSRHVGCSAKTPSRQPPVSSERNLPASLADGQVPAVQVVVL